MAESSSIVDSVTGPLQGVFGVFGSLGNYIKLALIGAIVFSIAGAGIWGLVSRKKWNLNVEFKFVRGDGKITNAEWGKGYYNTKKGYILLKRKGVKGSIEMKPADPKKYIYGDNILTVGQVGPNTWIPVHPDSFTQYVNDAGEVEYFIDLKTDLTDQLSWAEAFRRRSKETFSIQSFLEKYQTPIAIGFVVLAQAISTAFIIAVIT